MSIDGPIYHIRDYVVHGQPLIELNTRPILSAEEFVTAESIVTKFAAAGGVGEAGGACAKSTCVSTCIS